MATYGKKLLDSEGNIILPKTRSSLVYMDDNSTVEDKIEKVIKNIPYNGIIANKSKDIDNIASPGIYHIGMDNGGLTTGLPVDFFYGILIVSKKMENLNIISQILKMDSGDCWLRSGSISGTSISWESWSTYHFISTRYALDSNSDLDTLSGFGVYGVTPPLGKHFPNNCYEYGSIINFPNTSWTGYSVQFYIPHNSDIYVRGKSTIWLPWRKIATIEVGTQNS